jgi:hypothetical protein
MGQANMNVTLPEGASLQRLGQVLLDAWEAGTHQWTEYPVQLREGGGPSQALLCRPILWICSGSSLNDECPICLSRDGDADLCAGRNTKDVDLLMSVGAMEQVAELEIIDRQDFFVRGRFRTVQVDLLLTTNPLFKLVEECFSTRHRFAELEVPVATADGLILLKLYALPSLYGNSIGSGLHF